MRDPVKRKYFYAMMAVFGAISLSIVLFFMLFRMQGIGEVLRSLAQIMSPFIYGGVVAYLLRPMCNSYERFFQKHLPRVLRGRAEMFAVLFSFITLAIIVYTLFAMVVPQVYDSVITLWKAIPSRVRNFLAWADMTFGEDERMDVIFNTFNTSYEKLYEELGNWVQGTLVPRATTVITGVGSSMFKVLRVLYNILIGLIVAVYVLFSRKRFARQSMLIVRGLLNERLAETVLTEFALIDRMFGGFIDSKILDSALIGILCYLGCSILQMPNTLLVSVFIGVTNIIPFFGPFIGAIPSTLLIMIEDPLKAVWFVIFVLILQQVDGNVIGPRIMGDRIGISGFWVMFAIILFGGLFGVVGMVIGVPLFAVIYDLIRKAVRAGLRNKGKPELWDQYAADFPNEDMPVTNQQVVHVEEWTLEDWKNSGRRMIAAFRTKGQRIVTVASYVWAFVKKWALKIWEFLCMAWKVIYSQLQKLVKMIRSYWNRKRKK